MSNDALFDIFDQEEPTAVVELSEIILNSPQTSPM